MSVSKKLPKKYSEVLIAFAAVAFGLLVGPTIEKIIDPLFDTPAKAVLTGFVVLAFISIITVTAVGILLRNHDQQLDRFESSLNETKDQVRLSTSLEAVGISGAVKKHTAELFDELCTSANDEIRILQTYLGSVQQLPPSIFSAVKRGVKVKLLLLDHESELIKQRLRDAGLPDNSQVHRDAMDRFKLLLQRQKPSSDLFEVRTYKRIPPFALYKSDNEIRLGFFWHGEHSLTGPHIIVKDSNSILGKYAIDTFDDIWQSSIKVNIGG